MRQVKGIMRCEGECLERPTVAVRLEIVQGLENRRQGAMRSNGTQIILVLIDQAGLTPHEMRSH